MTRFPRSLALILAATLATPAAAEDVVVFAAASMKTALDQIATDYGERTGDRVTVSYAGSNALAQQIMQGAPADVFISASVEWMDAVDEAGELEPGTRRDLLGNSLVLIAPQGGAEPATLDDSTDLAAMLGGGKLAMGMVDSVPAGQYGKAALESVNLWNSVEDSVAQADNVRAALALVATGEAPLGIVYATDAAAEPAVQVVGTFAEDTHPPITYPAALVARAGDAAASFLDALSGPEAAQVFEGEGFTLIQADG
ncbi:molybdate ABC transporter substrate-binding protein [Paracoccus sp. TK19116]|uniref:Molybdate ABC transporter substrate-binding protein n=1 Tax=Paracoccus albicereus TaxID=2922394 RepID=A0ABT1MUE0_9RHOB|nr:molybdate ABC transporter substrate-binding protein [Paracoccus albicereus]MCQ0971930.1 molybdate ABC transporter substrate-binding protein [Paracoccus albicereus]